MIGIIIQARLGSTRLPQKMVIPFYDQKGILEVLLERINGFNFKIPVILATTTNSNDKTLVKIANQKGVETYCGSEENVLNRFIDAAEHYKLSKVVRICADNPFLDMNALQYLIGAFDKIDVDYWCYVKQDNTPTIKTHFGFWAEGVRTETLNRIAELTDEKLYKEHVTNYIYLHPDIFSILNNPIPKNIEDKNIRLTIDTSADFENARIIYAEVIRQQIPFKAESISNFVSLNSNWMKIMQKEINNNIK